MCLGKPQGIRCLGRRKYIENPTRVWEQKKIYIERKPLLNIYSYVKNYREYGGFKGSNMHSVHQ